MFSNQQSEPDDCLCRPLQRYEHRWCILGDETGRVVVEAIWCIRTHLVTCISIEDKADIQISAEYRFSYIGHFKIGAIQAAS